MSFCIANRNTYFAGNSLTEDLTPLGVEAYLRQYNFASNVGMHILGGITLPLLQADPFTASTTREPYQDLEHATNITNGFKWDDLVFQVWNSTTNPSSMIQDQTAILALNKSRRVWIYGPPPATPSFSSSGYDDWWLGFVNNTDNTLTVRKREYYEHLAFRTNAEQIPVGEVFYEINQNLSNFPGITDIADLYRDTVHLTTGYGRWIACATAVTALTGKAPFGKTIPNYFDSFNSNLVAPTLAAIQRVINRI